MAGILASGPEPRESQPARGHADLCRRTKKAGITFEAPRGSLPFFTPPVAKYADNGRAQSKAELRRYFAEYLRRNPRDFLLHQIEAQAFDRFHAFVPGDSRAFALAKRAYYAVNGIPRDS